MRMRREGRRPFLKQIGALPVLATGIGKRVQAHPREAWRRTGSPSLKISLNAYSFNRLLRSGEVDLEDLLEFCARHDFLALDPTGYYFPGYPDVPSDEYLYRFKKKAFLLGLDISGTGVRNDFTQPDPAARDADLHLIRKWVECAARMGSPNLRVFPGREVEPERRAEVTERVVDGLRRAAEYGSRFGVMIALQNHAEFLKTADEVLEILERVDSEWLGINLDIGSFRSEDPYADIARVAPYAITWQIKEELTLQGKRVKTDLVRVARIIRESGYRGYIPIETLGPEDPRVSVPRFLEQVREAVLQTS